MQSKDSIVTSAMAEDLQWIVCYESYHYLNFTYVKEICCLCIQNGHYINMHVKQFNIFAGDAQIDTTFRIQRMRHGLAWEMGDVEEHEMESLILATINQNATIFMRNTHLIHMLNNFGYRDVQILRYEPSNQLLSTVEAFCNHSHDHHTKSCAQRASHHMYHYLKPMLLPYLYTNTFKLEFYNGSLPVLIIPPQLQQSLYKPNTTPASVIALHREFGSLQLHESTHSELGVAGADGYDGGLGLAQATAANSSQYQVGETSNQAAGAVDYQVL